VGELRLGDPVEIRNRQGGIDASPAIVIDPHHPDGIGVVIGMNAFPHANRSGLEWWPAVVSPADIETPGTGLAEAVAEAVERNPDAYKAGLGGDPTPTQTTWSVRAAYNAGLRAAGGAPEARP